MIIVANWKANKTIEGALGWLSEVGEKLRDSHHEISVASAYPQLYPLKIKLAELNLNTTLCAQTVSNFERGQYTGEVTAEMLSGIVKYCLVGHSERRRNFDESTDEVSRKVELLINNNITPIICASIETDIPENIQNYEQGSYILMFEPVEAISKDGVYQEINLTEIGQKIGDWKSKYNCLVLYGGSVNTYNISQIKEMGVDGFVIGHASLDPIEFSNLLTNL